MSLPGSQQRALDQIERTLMEDDRQLGSPLAARAARVPRPSQDTAAPPVLSASYLAGLDDGELLSIAQSPAQGCARAAAAAAREVLAAGGILGAYAQPTIMGELRRHFRDGRWPVHVRRTAQELMLAARAATEELTHELARAPSEADLAARLGVSTADLRDAQLAETAFAPLSLDAPLGDSSGAGSLADVLGGEDRRIEHMPGMRAVAAHWDELPARERAILVLRFHGGLSRAEIGRRVGVSQMQVSQLISHALGYLRPRLLS